MQLRILAGIAERLLVSPHDPSQKYYDTFDRPLCDPFALVRTGANSINHLQTCLSGGIIARDHQRRLWNKKPKEQYHLYNVTQSFKQDKPNRNLT